MVHSELKPTLTYDEEQIVMEQDIGIDVDIYEFEIFHKTIHVIIGKENKKFMNRGILSYSIYAIVKNVIRARLGIIEIPAKEFRVYDVKNKTPDFSLYTPVLFSFVNSHFIDLLDSRDAVENEDEDDNLNTPYTIDNTTPSPRTSTAAAAATAHYNDLFIQTSFKPLTLQEESYLTAKSTRKKYVEDTDHNWIQKFMKNPHYKIEYNSGRGDCFFYVIIQAFNQIGKETNVKKLRNLLSQEITDDIFVEHKKLYENIIDNKEHIVKELKEMKINLKKAKVFLDTIGTEMQKKETQDEKEKYIKQNKKEIKIYTEMKEKSEKKIKDLNEELKNESEIEEYIDMHMKKIKTFDEYKEYIKTSEYWVDTWAISTFEWILNIKFIILNSSKYPDSPYEILECGEKNKNIHNTFMPTYYIITTYNGHHYELVIYKKKGIFTFIELPYDMRILIINKCMEKNAGLFNHIPDFRDFQARIGIDTSSSSSSSSSSSDLKENYDGLYDVSIIFMFYNKSSSLPKPGKGSGEKIPLDKIKDYVPLSKFNDWRRKLDDSWMDIDNPIVIDKKKWASVSHYMWGVPFKNNFPEKYILFSLHSDNKISKSYELAKKENARHIDTIHDDFMTKDYTVERENALRIKFSHPEMKAILIATKKATLLHFENKNAPKEDKLLMFIRKEFM